MTAAAENDFRLSVLRRWVEEDLGFTASLIAPASADASFRRYFRITHAGETYIAMDAPPDKEDLAPFVRVAALFAGIGLNVPLILARNEPDGLLLLTDLGTRQYLDTLLADQGVDRLYGDALAALVTLQTRGASFVRQLPAYDAALLNREMDLLPEWFLGRHLKVELGDAERALLARAWSALTDAALEQAVTVVHRDFHSRNLMLVDSDNPGILDFQDAVAGPLTYDLVSLLKDCYVAWPAARVRDWALAFRRRLLAAGGSAGTDQDEFLRWFDLMGLQRHVKVLGIFCRLYYRDGKAQYLRDLPRVLQYATEAAARYPETAEFAAFLGGPVASAFATAQARVSA
jgi:aminoglycoside/choline kinase family phosphotransferase